MDIDMTDQASWLAEVDAVIVLSFLSAFLAMIPLYWHLEAWNVGCVMYIFWSASRALIQGINCTIWRDNVINWAPVWCDITSRWQIASSVGILASSLVINRRLYKIATVSTVSRSFYDKRQMIIVDLSISIGIPVVETALYWFYQGHRFNIIEGSGCNIEVPNTILSYFLYQSWPLAIGLVSLVYCVLTLRAFLRRRKQMNELISSNQNLTYHRYLRLMGLSIIELSCTVPLSLYLLISATKFPIYTWYGLANLHYDFSRVVQYPAWEWRQDPLSVQTWRFSLYVTIICPLLFFVFFGLAEEARNHYHAAATTVMKRMGLSTSWLERTRGASGYNISKPSMRSVTIPTFARPARRPSLLSFSDRLSSAISIDDNDGIEELKLPYSPSEHSAGSSTFVPSPADAKSVQQDFLAMLPPSPLLTVPPPAHGVSMVERQVPDVPASVPRNDSDIV